MTPDDLFNVKRETAEVEQRGVRTQGYREIHVTRLDRIAANYRTEYTHVTQAAPGRGRENLPPIRRVSVVRPAARILRSRAAGSPIATFSFPASEMTGPTGLAGLACHCRASLERSR